MFTFLLDALKMVLSVPVSALLGSAKDAKVFIVKKQSVEQQVLKQALSRRSKVAVIRRITGRRKGSDFGSNQP